MLAEVSVVPGLVWVGDDDIPSDAGIPAEVIVVPGLVWVGGVA